MYTYIYMSELSPSGDSQNQETFLAPSAEKQTRNYDTEYSNHHPYPYPPLSKRLSHNEIKLLAIYIYHNK